MSKEDDTAKEVAMTLKGLKKCSMCRGRGRVLSGFLIVSDDEIEEHDCAYCKGTGWVVPRVVRAQ